MKKPLALLNLILVCALSGLTGCNRYQVTKNNFMVDKWTGRSWVCSSRDKDGNPRWDPCVSGDASKKEIVLAPNYTGQTYIWTDWNGRSHRYTSKKEYTELERLNFLY